MLDADLLAPQEKDYFRRICDTMSDAVASISMKRLAEYLSRYYGKNVIILLDEYDTPVQEAYLAGYWKEMLSFTRLWMPGEFQETGFGCMALHSEGKRCWLMAEEWKVNGNSDQMIENIPHIIYTFFIN